MSLSVKELSAPYLNITTSTNGKVQFSQKITFKIGSGESKDQNVKMWTSQHSVNHLECYQGSEITPKL